MSAVCVALAIAAELSERTLAATAAFTGAAMFALMSDIAARSGSSSPASSLSASRVIGLYSDMSRSPLVALRDVGGLRGVGVRDGAVGERVERDGGVDRGGHVGVDERHCGALGELLAGELVELLAGH